MSDTTTTVAIADVTSKDAVNAIEKLARIRDAKSPEARTMLKAVGTHIPSAGQIKRSEGHVSDLTGQLELATTYRDELITYRNRAIITAQSVGFSVSAICEDLHVSRGTVQYFADARKVREALKRGGTTNPPSIERLYSEVTNLPTGGLAEVIKTAETTGALPPKADRREPAKVTPKGILSRAESVSDSFDRLTVAADDVDTLTKAAEVLGKAAAKAAAAVTAAKAARTAAAEAAKAAKAADRKAAEDTVRAASHVPTPAEVAARKAAAKAAVAA